MREWICGKIKVEFDASPFRQQMIDDDGIFRYVKQNQTIHQADCDMISFGEETLNGLIPPNLVAIHHYYKDGAVLNATKYSGMQFQDQEAYDKFQNISNIVFNKSELSNYWYVKSFDTDLEIMTGGSELISD